VNAAALVVVIALVVGLLNALLKANEEVLTLAEQRSRELEVSNREVQEVIAAERSARDQQRLESQQLQESVSEYLTFLDKVSAGDYAAKLDLDMIAAQVQNPDIVRLGEALNATVDTLVEVLAEFQVLQQRYLREGWNMFLESESVERVYRVVDEEARTGDVSQFEPLDAALDARKLVVRREDAAIPIEFGGEILGVLGLRRHEGHWTAEDVALIETITDQLAQTMETLRLIDTTQRQVQREQTLSDLSERFARAFDVDLLLQSAVRDLRQILQVDEVSVYVGPSGSAEPVDAGSAVKAPGGDVV
ncbi:MAG: GAF domain-containing protein, partial [Anaerolineae bacterium]|nr:GAF domain-containing protein [Anaerolineae bacterium]